MENYIKDFLSFLKKDKRLSENTLQSYNRDIKQFCSYLKSNNMDILDVNTTNIITYLNKLQEKGKATATITRALASIRSFYQFLYRIKVVSEDPTITLESPKTEKKAPNVLSTDEVDLLLEQPKGMDLKSVRDKAMLETAYATGMRVTEIISLDVEDVNLDQAYVKCKCASKERIIPLGSLCVKALREYIKNARPILIKSDDTTSLFVNINGKKLTRQGFWKIIKYYKEQAHIEKNITPHVLRHSFAANLLQNGAELKAIQTMLGHSDISSTQVYMQFQDNGLKDIYKKAHPRA